MPQKTVFVTGATGYIAKHIVLQLLNAGHRVVGSSRSVDRLDEMQKALRPHLKDPASLDHMSLVALDLTTDAGWDTAMQGADVMMHTASPVPIRQPKDPQVTIRPAVDGAMRAVRAARAAGIRRVIMTSSIAAVSGTDLPMGKTVYDEDDWTDLNQPRLTPYTQSKTLAERAVWDWQKDEAPEMQITMINPAFVMGPPLDCNFASSIHLIERVLKRMDPMLPRIGFHLVDVRDIAAMHLNAMERDASIGQRFIGTEAFLWFEEIADLLRADHPDLRIAKRRAPNWLMRVMALFDPAIRSVITSLDRNDAMSNARAHDVLGINFHDSAQAVRDTGQFLVKGGHV
ncbi:MAG: NAD-dependent epimerase/dehydratase family protein [Sedimentitalea sp.]